MLTGLRSLGTKFASWLTGEGVKEGAKTMAKQAAVKGVTRQGLAGVQHSKDAINDLTNKGYDPLTGQKSGVTLANWDKGQKKMGFFGSLGVSVLIGVAVSFVVPGAGFIAVGIVQGLGTAAVETAVGALSTDETTTPAPTPEPVEENLPPVSGTDPEPGDPGYQPQPAPTPFIYSNVTAAPHQPDPEPCDPDDPHGSCYNPPHEDPHGDPHEEP